MANVFEPPGFCPCCGAHVPRGSLSCPDCGADEDTGWNHDATAYDGLNLPGEESEWLPANPEHSTDMPKSPSVLRTVLAAGLIVILILGYVFRRFL